MGGGEGVGGLEDIVDELYISFMKQGLKASIYVVCGRNENLKEKLANKDWDKVLRGEHKPIRKRTKFARFFRSLRGKHLPDEPEESNGAKGDVKVVGLGFVTQMAEYMVSADVLVSKAGPGL
jgi:1,2-diacylglycerol 3-beta-galactosyltransferase